MKYNLICQKNELILHDAHYLYYVSAGNSIPITELDKKVVAKYMEDVREKTQALFLQYKRLYRPGEVILVVLLNLPLYLYSFCHIISTQYKLMFFSFLLICNVNYLLSFS